MNYINVYTLAYLDRITVNKSRNWSHLRAFIRPRYKNVDHCNKFRSVTSANAKDVQELSRNLLR